MLNLKIDFSELVRELCHWSYDLGCCLSISVFNFVGLFVFVFVLFFFCLFVSSQVQPLISCSN